MSSKFIYCIRVYLTSDDNGLVYVRSGICHRYRFLFFGNRFDGEAFICFYKWHFILYFAHRKHFQKPVKKLKIDTEISQEFYSKEVGKYVYIQCIFIINNLLICVWLPFSNNMFCDVWDGWSLSFDSIGTVVLFLVTGNIWHNDAAGIPSFCLTGILKWKTSVNSQRCPFLTKKISQFLFLAVEDIHVLSRQAS